MLQKPYEVKQSEEVIDTFLVPAFYDRLLAFRADRQNYRLRVAAWFGLSGARSHMQSHV